MPLQRSGVRLFRPDPALNQQKKGGAPRPHRYPSPWQSRLPSPRPAKRHSGRRAFSARRPPRRRTPRWRRPRGCSVSVRRRARGERRRPRRRARRGLTPALRDRLALSEERIAAMADGVRAVAALDDPVGEELDQRTLESGLSCASSGAARGRRRRLRGAAQRDDRLRGADDQERQRDRPARLQLGRAHQRGAGGDRARGARRGRAAGGCGGAAGRGGREELAELATQEDTVDLLIPRGGEGLKAR